MRNAALTLLTSATLAILTASHAAAEIKWQTNLRAAQASAEADGKLMLLHFYSDNCVFCDRLEAGAYQDQQVHQAIGMSYIPVKINGTKNPKLVEMFKVTKFPTDVIVTAKGKSLSHLVSPQLPSRYVSMLGGAVTMSKQANPVTASAASPAQVARQPLAANQSQQPSQGSQQTPAGQKTNQFVLPGKTTLSNGGIAQMASTRTGDMKLSVQPTAATAAIPTTPSKSAEKADEPELAMQGFCPVTVIQEDRWVEGIPKFGVIHLGKLYLFANADNMQTFLADPIPYTPVLNELDVVRFFEEHKIVKGKREWGLKDPTHNRMFFFADEAAMNHFWNEYERYTGAAISVMEKAVRDSNPGI